MRQSVIIIGAGASCAYGFPCGKSLRNEIVRLLSGLDPYQDVNSELIRDSVESESIPLNEFLECFDHSAYGTVDEFMENAEAPYRRIAMMSTAGVLSRFETAFAESRDPRDDDWCQVLIDGVHSATPAKLSALKIITFNYDRVIERRVLGAAHMRAKARNKPCKWPGMPFDVLHVHGSLGEPLGHEGNWKMIGQHLPRCRELSNRMLTYSDPEPGETWQKARQTIADAGRILFLGFGFHHRNLNNLGFVGNKSRESLSMAATCYGLSSADCARAEEITGAGIQFLRNAQGPQSCLQALEWFKPFGG